MSSRADGLPEPIRALYPFVGRVVQQPGGMQHVLDEGDGVPVVMVHGNPTWSFHFRQVVVALRAHHRCVVPDHLGCGLSDKPQDGFGYQLVDHIDNLERLLDRLGVRSCHLLLHDWGGAIGMGYAVRHPDRIRSIALLNTAAFCAPWIPLRIAACRVPVLGEWLVRGLNGFAGPAAWMTTVRPLASTVRRGYLHPYGNWRDRIAVHRFVRDIPLHEGHPSWDTLKAIEEGLSRFSHTPVEIFWGMNDWCFHEKFLREWERRWPHAGVHRLPDVGHYALEDAGSVITARLQSFYAAAQD